MEQLQRIRSMWQFANLCQWIYIFGDAASIDDSVDVDVSTDFFSYFPRERILTIGSVYRDGVSQAELTGTQRYCLGPLEAGLFTARPHVCIVAFDSLSCLFSFLFQEQD